MPARYPAWLLLLKVDDAVDCKLERFTPPFNPNWNVGKICAGANDTLMANKAIQVKNLFIR